jgi:hypothetical protein
VGPRDNLIGRGKKIEFPFLDLPALSKVAYDSYAIYNVVYMITKFEMNAGKEQRNYLSNAATLSTL